MMNRLLLVSAIGLIAAAFAACGGSDDGIVAGYTPDSGGTGPGGDGGPATGDSSDLPDGTGPGPGIPKPTACPASKFKTVVIVGDSISDVGGSGGGAGQQPFYRTLLLKNDDKLYPDWKGFDLSTCWGLDPTTNVVKASQGGAIATVPPNNTPGDSHILFNQAVGLPATLPGPVLVVGTIGGNDVTGGLVTVLTGTPAQLQTKIDAFAAGFGQAMAELTKVDRFGAGVKATVLMTNVYDPSGGSGHFYYEPNKASCPGALGLWPDAKPTAALLAQWNTAMATEAAKYPGLHLLELRVPFDSHSVSTATDSNWFYRDCIHPSSLGHNAVRGVFFTGMVALK
jgi:GDSL-like Lipase/Acylhydrolase family